MQTPAEIDTQNIPQHIAIIMDGNGRWAENRNLPRAVGHKHGVKTVHDIVEAARELGVQVLTLYAFSTENWQRPKVEVQALMGLLKTYLQNELENLIRNDIQLRCLGEKAKFPEDVREQLDRTIQKTADRQGMILNLALSYGGRNEILTATKNIAKKCIAGTLEVDDITEDLFSKYLYTTDLSDPDLLIRTGGECRLSNFLLWQASYSELYFTDILWPDFSKDDFTAAIKDYQIRQRRFGKTGSQV